MINRPSSSSSALLPCQESVLISPLMLNKRRRTCPFPLTVTRLPASARAMPPRSLRTIVILVATALVVSLVSSVTHSHLPLESIQQHFHSLSRLQVPHLQVPQQLQWGSHEMDDTHGRPEDIAPHTTSPARYNLSEIWFPQVEKTAEDRLWIPKNNRALRELLACMQEGTCRPNQVRCMHCSEANS